MGFGDKLKDLRKQAQEAVAEHSDQLHNVLDVAGAAANEKTRGKHTQRIVKFGEKANEKLDKFAAGDEAEQAEAGSSAPDAAAPAAGAPDSSMPAGEPEAPTAPPSVAPPAPSSAPPATPGPPPAANPDLAAWAAGDDSAAQQ